MKERTKIRKPKLKIRNYFLYVSLTEILVAVLIASGSTWIINTFWKNALPLYVWVFLFTLVSGGVIALAVSKHLVAPMMELRKAMQQVTMGDYTVQLDTQSKIREIHDIYNSFNLMTHALRATEILQSDFISNVSHEFKTPINAIEGYTTLLQGNMEDPEGLEYIEKILRNTHRLSTLVGNILLLSRIDNQTIRQAQQTYRLDEQVRNAILLLESEWSAKDIEFDVDLEDTVYTGPESLMQHVWVNLIGNAVKFGPASGLVRIRLNHRDDRIVFVVEDAGAGIPEGERELVFNRFYQSDSSHRQEGNGLGLSLCKQIVEQAGGTISVRESLLGGALFEVTLSAS